VYAAKSEQIISFIRTSYQKLASTAIYLDRFSGPESLLALLTYAPFAALNQRATISRLVADNDLNLQLFARLANAGVFLLSRRRNQTKSPTDNGAVDDFRFSADRSDAAATNSRRKNYLISVFECGSRDTNISSRYRPEASNVTYESGDSFLDYTHKFVLPLAIAVIYNLSKYLNIYMYREILLLLLLLLLFCCFYVIPLFNIA